jgi:hypothetical protein
MLEIALLGTNHLYQRQQLFPIAAFIELGAHQRACYIAWVWQHIHSFAPQVIFDEMDLAESDYKFEESAVPWVYMDIPEHVRARFGLKVARTGESNLTPSVDEPRENYWLNLVEQMVIACEVSKVIVICGANHDRWLRPSPTP